MSAGPGVAAVTSRSFASDRRAWLLLLAVVAGSVGLTRWWSHRRVVVGPVDAPPPAVADWRLATLFWPRADGSRMEAHVEALRRAGFHAVTVEQVEAALAGKEGLPARSLLLTVDDSRVETFDSVDPLLRRLGWTALMLLDPRPQRARDVHHVNWHRLELMVSSGAWRLGARTDADRAEIESHVPGARLASIAPADDPFGITAPGESGATPTVLRLAVRPEWSGEDLVARLEAAIVVPPPDVPAAAATFAGAGVTESRGGEVTLEHPTRADLWLPGLRFAGDWAFEGRVRLDRGQLWVVHEGAPGRTLWRAGLDARALYVQQDDGSGTLRALARRTRPRSNDPWGTLRVVKRGRGLFASWNGVPFADGAVTLDARAAGRVALVAASDGAGARAAAAGLRVTPLSERLAKSSGDPAASEVRRLAAAAQTTSGVSPAWIEIRSAGVRESRVNRDLYAMLAHRYALDVLPEVLVKDVAVAARPEVAAEVARRAVAQGFEGVRIVFDGLPDPGAREGIERELRARELRVAVAR